LVADMPPEEDVAPTDPNRGAQTIDGQISRRSRPTRGRVRLHDRYDRENNCDKRHDAPPPAHTPRFVTFAGSPCATVNIVNVAG
jgi:hypothetical protein